MVRGLKNVHSKAVYMHQRHRAFERGRNWHPSQGRNSLSIYMPVSVVYPYHTSAAEDNWYHNVM